MSLSRPPQRLQTLGPWAEIQLSAVVQNLNILRRKLPAGTRIAPVMTGNAYGHGLVPVAQLLEGQGVGGFCVAATAEGRQLREAGIQLPVYVLGPSREDAVDDLLIYQLTPAVTSLTQAKVLQKAAEEYSMSLSVHLRVDVGVGNLGLPAEQFVCELGRILELKNLEIEGIFTLFASPSEGNVEVALQEQIFRFEAALQDANELGVYPPLVHAASSNVILSGARVCYDMVRPGNLIYGLAQSDHSSERFRPVMSIKSRVMEVYQKSTDSICAPTEDANVSTTKVLASVAFGYADGMFMNFMRSGEVIVHGKRVPLVGTAHMDYAVVDVTNVEDVSVGDEVVLLGRQGQNEITVNEMAKWSGIDTENSDCISLLSTRVPRVYVAHEIL